MVDCILEMPLRRLSIEEMSQAMGMLMTGESLRTVAAHFNVSHNVIRRVRMRFNDTGSVRHRHGGGRNRSTTVREDRFITVQCRRNRFSTARTLQIQLLNATGTQAFTQTVRRRLHAVNLRSRSSKKCPLLTRAHKRRRLEWAHQHQNWNVEDWGRCLFSDETRVRLHSSDGRVKVWRNRGERYIENHVTYHQAYGGGSITVWGGISQTRRTELVMLGNATMNSVRYLNEVLQPVVLPFANEIGDGFVFVDDNARPHRTRQINAFFEENNITHMDWPANSPDLNPIENVWDYLKRLIRSRGVDPNNHHQLRTAVLEEWPNIPQHYIRDLISSMPRRCQEVIRARGGPTHY